MSDAKADTHKLFDTMGHIHLGLAGYDPPWLMAAETSDGRFFLEAEFQGDVWKDVPEVSYPWRLPYQHPLFFNSEAEVTAYGETLIRKHVDRSS